MKNKILYILIIALVFPGSFLKSDDDTEDYYFKMNKSFEIYGAIIRELSRSYVLELDPEELVNNSINGMLSILDPYTVYMDESDEEDFDMLSTGMYIGLGITVGTRDSMLTIVGLMDGYSAQKNGIRIGDRILKIDTNNTLYSNSDEIRKFTKGKPNTPASFTILRDGREDTLTFNLTRQEIEIKNVSYSGLIGDSIAYIRLDRFSKNSALEIKNSLFKFKSEINLKGLILDLRDNPGGLMEAAIDISELFVPDNSLIVSTKGREFRDERKYYSRSIPHDTVLPIAVLINGGSASSSEILAGAIQDLDRGIIVGKRSYGKGLVQVVYELPYKTALKVTIAKYYTPSGRCIQKINYEKNLKNGKKKKIESDSVFLTKNGRKVLESTGIKPDFELNDSTDISDFVVDLFVKDMFFKFANIYTSKLESLPAGFVVNDEILDKFEDFLKDKNYNYNSKLLSTLQTLRKRTESEKVSDKAEKMIDELESEITVDISGLISINSELLKSILSYEIFSRFNTETEQIKLSLKKDKYINKAIELLQKDNYEEILKPKKEDNNN